VKVCTSLHLIVKEGTNLRLAYTQLIVEYSAAQSMPMRKT